MKLTAFLSEMSFGACPWTFASHLEQTISYYLNIASDAIQLFLCSILRSVKSVRVWITAFGKNGLFNFSCKESPKSVAITPQGLCFISQLSYVYSCVYKYLATPISPELYHDLGTSQETPR